MRKFQKITYLLLPLLFFTPLESSASSRLDAVHLTGQVYDRDDISPARKVFSNGAYRKGGVKIPSFLTGFTLGFRSPESHSTRRTFPLMGTLVEIIIPEKSSRELDEILDGTIERMKSLAGMLTIFEETSEVSRINRLKKNELHLLSKDVYGVIKRSLDISRLTGGAFDVTVSPLLRLWRFEGGILTKIPEEEEIELAKKKVGWEGIILTPERKIGFKKEGMSINLGGIAPGYIVDKAVDFLRERGVRSALINAGGDIYCLGKRSEKENWRVGIRHPRKKGAIIGILELKDSAVATSGDYEKFFIIGGRRFSHIINPSTGWPVEHGVIQTTVIAPTATDADGLSTALMVMEKEKGLNLIEELKDIEAVIIEEDEKGRLTISYTSGLKNRIEILE